MTGRIHSIETCGTVDGPGIRFVVFLQGCPLRCQYCHNPDTWETNGGHETTVDELVEEIQKYRSYMKFSGGGVTVSGGEPLLQADFVRALFKRCRKLGIHTALDTSGFQTITPSVVALLAVTDLVLLDIKSTNAATYQTITGAPVDTSLLFARYLSDHQIPMWVRFVYVPGLSDNEDEIRAMAKFLLGLKNLQKTEVIPFHKMGEYKWAQLGYAYTLADTPVPHRRDVAYVRSIFADAGLKVGE